MSYDEMYYETLLKCVDASPLNHHNTEDNRINWSKVLVLMQAHYPDLGVSSEGLRSQYRRRQSSGLRQSDKRRQDLTSGRKSLEERLLFEIKHKRRLDYLVDRLGETEDAILASAIRLPMLGYTGVAVWQEEGIIWIHNTAKPVIGHETVDMSALWDGETIQFGVVSDNHGGSKFEALDALRNFYTQCANRGIGTVYHAGDITDGYYNIRPTSIFEQNAVGFTNQVDWVCDNYPEVDGITTMFITGNHDVTHFRNGFAEIGVHIQDRRPDLVYLGQDIANVEMTPNLTISLFHPNDKPVQSLDMRLRKLINDNPALTGQILLVGHYHKYASTCYNGVYGYCVPSFQKQTPFMTRCNIQSVVGGLIFTVRVDREGNLLSIGTEFIGYDQ